MIVRLHPSRTALASRRGSLTLELLFVFPIIFVLILAMVQFGMSLHANQQLTAASREGARVAACGGSVADVENRVKQVLGNGRLSEAEVIVEGETGGDASIDNNIPSGDAVTVWVRLPMNRAVPDLLRFIGYSIKEDDFIAKAVMRKE